VRLGLRLQLILAFGLLCAVLAGVLALSISGVIYLRTQTQHAITVAGEKSRIAHEVAIATLLCRRFEKDLFLNLDVPATRATYLTQWQAAYSSLQQTIDQYADLASTDEDRQQVATWEWESSVYQRAVLDTERAIAAGQVTTPQAANAALTPFKASIRTLTDSARERAQQQSAALQHTNAALTATSDQLLQLLIGVGLAALLFALGVSLLFPTQLLRPIHSLRLVTQRLAQGELTARADLMRADELGALADSFNQMADQIRQQIAELDQSAVVREQNDQLRALLELVQDLETPAIPLLDGVLLVPVVGYLDTRRVTLLQQRVIEAVHTQRAQVVILDLTGITMVDTKVAHAIQQFVAAVQLLGARTIVTGISAQVAQTVTHMGVGFERVQIAARVQEGIAAVLPVALISGRARLG
jgi:anti-anti-sigma regulatory factor/HAMP domain-containing protein